MSGNYNSFWISTGLILEANPMDNLSQEKADAGMTTFWTNQTEALSEGLSFSDGVYYADIHLAFQADPIKVALHGIRNSNQAQQVLRIFNKPQAAPMPAVLAD
jgi:hypothetical protein